MFARHQIQQNERSNNQSDAVVSYLRATRRRPQGGNSAFKLKSCCRLEYFVALNLLMLSVVSYFGSKTSDPRSDPSTIPNPRLREPQTPQDLVAPLDEHRPLKRLRGDTMGVPLEPGVPLLSSHNEAGILSLEPEGWGPKEAKQAEGGEQRKSNAEADPPASVFVKEQRSSDAEADLLPPLFGEEQRAEEQRQSNAEADPPASLFGKEQQSSNAEADPSASLFGKEQRSSDAEADILPPLFGEEQEPPRPAPGVVVLGMHRSGTSLLAGLLFRAGLWVGERRDLIWGADPSDNSKGFYERTDIALQNDALMKLQKVHWSVFADRFNSTLATAQHVQGGLVDWSYGKAGLAALTSPSHGPWLLKDPRLCLSLDFWVPLLSAAPQQAATQGAEAAAGGGAGAAGSSAAVSPAVLFTYRHPAEVARSLQRREGFGIKRGLLLWLSYNQRALASSGRLCRVVTSNQRLNTAPLAEANRVVNELGDRCGLAVPRAVTEKHVAEFVDPKLQRNHASRAPSSPVHSVAASGELVSVSAAAAAAAAVAASEVEPACVNDTPWSYFGFLDSQGKSDEGDTSTPLGRKKNAVLKAALTAFCDMESGRAFALDVDSGGQKGPFYSMPLVWD